MNPLALPHVTGPIFTINAATLAQGKEAARRSPRRRMVLPLHRFQNAAVQRLLNFLQPGTYIRPHCHPRTHATETVVVLEGKLRFFIFDPEGRITQAHDASAGMVIDIEPGVWHGMLCLAADTVILEAKCGPYDAIRDKTFAPWAPEEGASQAADYLRQLAAD